MTSVSVVGFIEVIKNYGFFKNLFEETIEWIKTYKPKVICFVDYPGFNLRVAKRLYKEGIAQKSGGAINLCYYISPQIWAWKSHRRFDMDKWLNSLLVIFPFEVNCYKDTNLLTKFVGHPFLENGYQNPVEYDKAGPILLLAGSRKAPVKRILPVMLDAFELLLKNHPTENALIIYPTEEIKTIIEKELKNRSRVANKVAILGNEHIFSGKALLASSGTMSLCCALAGIPGAVLYRAHPITYCLGRMVVKIDHMAMANILLKEDVYPEYIQGNAKPKLLVKELLDCVGSLNRRDRILKQSEELKCLLTQEDGLTSGAWLAPWLTS